MEIKYVFTQKRRAFGSPCHFSDVGPDLLVNIVPDDSLLDDYVHLSKAEKGCLCRAEMSRHEVNTISQPTESRGINHEEGGWPADVDHKDEDQVARFKKKIEKDEGYIATVRNLADVVEKVIMENNAINIYENYFEEEILEESEESTNLRTLNVYKDSLSSFRSVTDCSWSMDGTNLAVAYAPRKTEDPLDCLVWDVQTPVEPHFVLKPNNPVVCLTFSTQDVDCLAGGYDNGQVALWDLRSSGLPVHLTPINCSHLSSVTAVRWMFSKAKTEFLSTSKDGTIISWDMRNLKEPTASMKIGSKEEGCSHLPKAAYSVSCLNYDDSVPRRFVLGTNEGTLFNCNRFFEEPSEKIVASYETNSGPILALERNPFLPNLFAAATAFSITLWSEDYPRVGLTRFSKCEGYITDVAWCSTRPSVLFVSKTTGDIETWGVLLKHSEPLSCLKLCDDPLSCVRAFEDGGKMACGSSNGSIYLLQIPKWFGSITKSEKYQMAYILDRDVKLEELKEPMPRKHRLKELAARRASAEARQLKELMIPVDWAPEDKAVGRDRLPSLSLSELEKDEDRRAVATHVELETGETSYLETLEREVQTAKTLGLALIKVVTAVEADNTRFPYQETQVEEEFGEEEFLEDLGRVGESVKVIDQILDDISSGKYVPPEPESQELELQELDSQEVESQEPEQQ